MYSLLKYIFSLHLIECIPEIHKTRNIGDTERLWTEIDADFAMGIIRVLVSEDRRMMYDTFTNN
jgi:hypothetical protein